MQLARGGGTGGAPPLLKTLQEFLRRGDVQMGRVLAAFGHGQNECLARVPQFSEPIDQSFLKRLAALVRLANQLKLLHVGQKIAGERLGR